MCEDTEKIKDQIARIALGLAALLESDPDAATRRYNFFMEGASILKTANQGTSVTERMTNLGRICDATIMARTFGL